MKSVLISFLFILFYICVFQSQVKSQETVSGKTLIQILDLLQMLLITTNKIQMNLQKLLHTTSLCHI